MSDALDNEPQSIHWLERVKLEGSSEWVRVVFFERDGSRVLVRQVDPGEPEPDRVPMHPGDELIVMVAVSHVSNHTTPEVGNVSDLLFSQRIVPVRYESGRIIARTLRRDEVDTGERVHVRPGDDLTFEEGGMQLELDYLDDMESPTQSGHVPVTPSLWTWLTIGESHDESRTRYILSAARRLDTTTLLLIEIDNRRARLNEEGLVGPEIRRQFYQLIGAVELAVVGLGQAVEMVIKASDLIACRLPVPAQILASSAAIKAIRDAYEHIEERALGQTWGKPNPDALTIFDYKRLIADDVIQYGSHELELTTEVPVVVAEVRQFLKDAVANG